MTRQNDRTCSGASISPYSFFGAFIEQSGKLKRGYYQKGAIMAKAATTRPTTRKARAKKANAPMRNKPKDKSPAAKAKAEAKKAARTMAKTVKPGIRKSAAKRVEKTEKKAVLSAAALKRIETIKGKANGLILCIKQDVQAAAKGQVNAMQVQRMFKAMMEIVFEAREEMYRDPK
jgi:hypothetical protein